MYSLKIKKPKDPKNLPQWLFLAGSVVLLLFFRLGAFAFIIVWYVVLSIFINFVRGNKNNQIKE
jgi:hypothetical protein